MATPLIPCPAYDDVPRAVDFLVEAFGFTVHARYDDDAHHERARAAGAEVVSGPDAPDHGGRQYTCRDIAGHLWTFGSYDPWATTP